MSQPRFADKVHILLLKICLEKALSHSCPSMIPRDGKRAQKVNCFVVALDNGDDPYMLAKRAGKTHIGGLEWDPILKHYGKHVRVKLTQALA
jgi:hypothetical protein